MSLVFRASTPWRTRSFSLKTWRARFGRPGRGDPSRPRAVRASTRRAETRPVGNSIAEYSPDAITLRTSLVIHSVGETSRGFGVADHDRRRGRAERQPVMDQCIAIQEEGMIGTAEEARELVEQARADPDEFVFGSPQCLGQFHANGSARCAVEIAAGLAGKKPSWIKNQATRRLEARRAGESRPQWDVSRDDPSNPDVKARATGSEPSRRRGRSGSRPRPRFVRLRRANSRRSGQS